MWLGSVEAAGSGYQYVGRPCPEAQPCAETIARYDIQPDSGRARKALPGAVGHQARLKGHQLEDLTLVVTKVVKILDSVGVPGGGDPSGVEGIVTLCTSQPGSACQGTPGSNMLVKLKGVDGTRSFSSATSGSGAFRIAAPPGWYVAQAQGSGCVPKEVQVLSGAFAAGIQLLCFQSFNVDTSQSVDQPGVPSLPNS
jgi:hypothetical protein